MGIHSLGIPVYLSKNPIAQLFGRPTEDLYATTSCPELLLTAILIMSLRSR